MGELVAVNSPNYSSRAQTEQHLHLFEPRVGLNYSIDPQTVIRAGFGVSHPCIDCGSTSLEVSTSPFLTATSLAPPGLLTPISNPFPNGIIEPLGRSLKVMEPYSQFPQTLIGGSIIGQEPHQTYTYAMQWNLNLERSIGSSISTMVAYSGSRGLHLGTYDVNLDQLPDQYDSLGSQSVDADYQSSAGHCHPDRQRGGRNGLRGPVPFALSGVLESYQRRQVLRREQLQRPAGKFEKAVCRGIDRQSQLHLGAPDHERKQLAHIPGAL